MLVAPGVCFVCFLGFVWFSETGYHCEGRLSHPQPQETCPATSSMLSTALSVPGGLGGLMFSCHCGRDDRGYKCTPLVEHRHLRFR